VSEELSNNNIEPDDLPLPEENSIFLDNIGNAVPDEIMQESDVITIEPLLEEEAKTDDNEVKEVNIEELEKKSALADEYLDHLKRLQAEFDNYRKRTERERQDFVKFALSEFLLELVDISEYFERGLSAAENSTLESFKEGVEMIYKQFMTLLEKRGLTKIEAKEQKFDPFYHEAISRIANNDLEEGVILEEVKPGYKLHDKLLKPSKVIVSYRDDNNEVK